MTVQWIPSHAGIEGNELADKEAEKQAKLPPINGTHTPPNTERCKT